LWLTDLALFVDVVQKLHILNLELQGRGKHVADVISAINAFRSKLLLWKSQLSKKITAAFPKCGKNYQGK
jgi:hypothetical protein